MTVAFSTKATAQKTGAATTSTTMTGLVVGVTVTDLVAGLSFGGDPGTVTVHWDSTGTNQLMSQLVSNHSSDSLAFDFLFGVHNPTADASGTKTLSVSWVNSVDFCMDMWCYTGGGAFQNANSNTGSTANATLAVTSGANDAVALHTATSVGSLSGSVVNCVAIYNDNTNVSGAAAYDTGATVTATMGATANPWVIVGVGITFGAVSPASSALLSQSCL